MMPRKGYDIIMKGIFSGLDKLGLGKLEKVEVFEHEEPKQKGKDAPKGEATKAATVSEEDFLFEKTYVCPVCDNKFHSKKVRTGRVKLLAADTDLRPKYQHIDCLKYDAVACPKCGYAALDRFFKFMMPAQAKMIRENISASFKGLPPVETIYTYDDAIERHQLALVNAIVKKAKESEKAYTCLKMAWIYRGKAESLGEDASQEEKDELAAQERELLENAYEGFETSFMKESFPMCGMDEITVSYLLAELARRIGRYEESSRWVSRVLVSKAANERIKDKARDIKELLNEHLK
jgi:hypothetical protein